MSEPRFLDDDVLTAYLDNEVDAETRRAIEEALTHDTGLRDRLEALRFPTEFLDAAATDLLSAAPPPPDLNPKSGAPPSGRPHRFLLAAGVVLGAVMGAAVMSYRADPMDGWKDYVAAYQALYVSETLASVNGTPEEADARLAELGQTLGRDLSEAISAGTLRFKRGQILGYRGKTLVQLAYLNPLGEPVALCIIRGEDKGMSGIKTATLEGMAAAFWEKDGFAFLLIGGTDGTLIETVAKDMAQRL